MPPPRKSRQAHDVAQRAEERAGRMAPRGGGGLGGTHSALEDGPTRAGAGRARRNAPAEGARRPRSRRRRTQEPSSPLRDAILFSRPALAAGGAQGEGGARGEGGGPARGGEKEAPDRAQGHRIWRPGEGGPGGSRPVRERGPQEPPQR